MLVCDCDAEACGLHRT